MKLPEIREFHPCQKCQNKTWKVTPSNYICQGCGEHLKKVIPNLGGCWFCNLEEQFEPLTFDFEFDTWVHVSCIEEGLVKGSEEAEIMKYLLPGEQG